MPADCEPDWEASPGETVLALVDSGSVEDASSAAKAWSAAFKRVAGALKHTTTRDVFLWMAEQLGDLTVTLGGLQRHDADFTELDDAAVECSWEVDTVFDSLAKELERLHKKTPMNGALVLVEELGRVDRVWMGVGCSDDWDELNAGWHSETRDVFLWMAEQLDLLAIFLSDLQKTHDADFKELTRLAKGCSWEIDTVFKALADEIEHLHSETPMTGADVIVEELRKVDSVWMAVCGFDTWDDLNERTQEIAGAVSRECYRDGENFVDYNDEELCGALVMGVGSKDDPIEVE